MFRSSSELPNPLDPCIIKATSETLTQDNWEYILDACDQVSSDPEDGAHNAILSIEKRLKIKDGNVLLRTLSLITALAENCGSKMKQEIATKKFCNILKDLINDRKTYLPIKYKIVEMIEQLSKSFASDPSLRIVSDTYTDIKLSQPDLVMTFKPQKHEITESDRLKEEEELDLALKLSLQEYESKQGPGPGSVSSNSQRQQQQQQQQQQFNTSNQQFSSQTNKNNTNNTNDNKNDLSVSDNNSSNIATVSRVKALYDLSSYEPDELSFKKGDVITVIESVYRDWWRGSLRGKIGIFPLNYVTPLKEPTTEELMAELKLEHLLLTKSTEVEKLLSLLSNFSTRLINNKVSNEELSSMVQDDQLSGFYKDVVSLRPQLAKLIEKYSTKKDEMIALNTKLVDSERLYNELMESSFKRFMDSRAQQQQQQTARPPPQQQFQQLAQTQFMNQPGANNYQTHQQQPTTQNSYPPQQNYQQQSVQYHLLNPASSISTPVLSQHPISNQSSPYQFQQPTQPQQQPQQPQSKISHNSISAGYPPQQQSYSQQSSPMPQQLQLQLQLQQVSYPVRPQHTQGFFSSATPNTSSASNSPYPNVLYPPRQQQPQSQQQQQVGNTSLALPPYPSYGI